MKLRHPEKALALVTRTIYPRGRNKGSGSKFQRISLEEGRSVQPSKRREHGNKYEDNSPNDVDSVDNTQVT